MNNGTYTSTVPTRRPFADVPDVDQLASEADVPTPTSVFPVHCLPPTVSAMASAVADIVQVPISLSGPVALGMLSGAIGARLELESGPARTCRPNLYLLVSAASGSGKSETLRLLGAPLTARERQDVETHRRDTLPGILADLDLLGVEIERLKKAARGEELTAAGREELRAQLQVKRAAQERAEVEKQDPVLTVENVTTEKLALLLSRREETLFSLSGDAGGIVNNLLGRYNKAERTDESLYLKAWTGEPERVDRLGRESVTLNRPCLSALWLVQPDKVESLLANAALSDGGLLPRFLICHSGCEPQEISDGHAVGMHEATSQGWSALVEDLVEHWRKRRGEASVVRPAEGTHVLFREHFNASVRRYHTGELRDVNSFRARWTEQGWRIALCLHAGHHGGEAGARPLSVKTAAAALEITDWFVEQQLGVLAKGRTERRLTRLEGLCTRLIGYGGSASLRDLEKANGFMPAEVRALAAAFPQRLSVELRSAGPQGGRPSEVASLPSVTKRP